MAYVIGVDVGTGSARAGVFDRAGSLLGTASHPLAINRPAERHVEQSASDIWRAVCRSVRRAVADAAVPAGEVTGLAFSATCSLVLRDTAFEPLALSPGDQLWDIVMWMDHRAHREAEACTASGSPVLSNLGGKMSLEMQIPKLMWLKRNRPDLWERLGYAGDLGDFLSFKCTGSFSRSVCTLGCKWTYDPQEGRGWNKDFLAQMDVADLLERANLPESAAEIGAPIGRLTQDAAADLGLTTDCSVATGLIDAHAGALGTLGPFLEEGQDRRLALIGGTSNCHIAVSPERREVPGVWGPYLGAVCTGFWANEGGQSAAGALLDHVVSLFSAGADFAEAGHPAIWEALAPRVEGAMDPAPGLHVRPDFLGNRSPFADPSLTGAIEGLVIEDPKESFLKIYWATAASVAYGTRLIMERFNANGFAIDTIHLSGGHAKSPHLTRLYAEATGCTVRLPASDEPVLLGAAMAAWAQFETGNDMLPVAARIAGEGKVVAPDPAAVAMHDRRYREFRKLYDSLAG